MRRYLLALMVIMIMGNSLSIVASSYEVELLGSPTIAPELTSYYNTGILNKDNQQAILIASLMLAGYATYADIIHLMANTKQQNIFAKGLISYLAGKQLYHYSTNPIVKEGGTLLAHYGKTVMALLLMYG